MFRYGVGGPAKDTMSAERANSTRVDYRIATSSRQAAESDLIERAKTDSAAFGELYETHYDTILNYIYRHTLDVSLAEELASNTFFRALRALPRYRHRAPFRAWLYRIATNEVRMHWRKEKRRRASEDDPLWKCELERIYFAAPEAKSEEEREEKMRAYARLHGCLSALSERYRIVLLLRYFEELSYEEIANVLSKRVGTVKSLVHRGIRRLESLMEDQNATFSENAHYHG